MLTQTARWVTHVCVASPEWCAIDTVYTETEKEKGSKGWIGEVTADVELLKVQGALQIQKTPQL